MIVRQEGKHLWLPVIVSALLLFVLLELDATGAEPPGTGREERTALDLDAPPTTNIQLLPGLSFGAQVEMEFTLQNNFDLDKRTPDRLRQLEPNLELAFSYIPVEKVGFFLDMEFAREIIYDEANEQQSRTLFELKEAYVSFNELIQGVDLRVGRQSFKDKREWLYDQEMDAARLFYSFSSFSVDISVSEENDRELLHGEDVGEITNLGFYGRYVPNEDSLLGAYVFLRNDREQTNESPVFFGLHASGESFENLEYWLELAHVRGRSGSNRLNGIGFDLGSTYVFDLPLKPSITLGYAFGSGDAKPFDSIDTSFRQTGLQENEAKFNGVTSFQYYGEMFDPELSNIGIFTAGLGLRPIKDFSIDFIYHHYRQQEASTAIRNSSIDRDPNGLSTQLGQEFDLVAGYKSKKHFKAKLAFGYFKPGKAFSGADDGALFTEVEIQFEL